MNKKEYFKRLVELAENAKLAYQEMIEEYEREECENLITMQQSSIGGSNSNSISGGGSVGVPSVGGVGVRPQSSETKNVTSMIMPSSTGLLLGNHQVITHHHLHHHLPPMSAAAAIQPKIPSHMGHSRTPSNGSNISIEPFYHHMNYHTHSRSASGNFNYGQTTVSFSGVLPGANASTNGNGGGNSSSGGGGNGGGGGHSRSASGGGALDLGLASGKPWLPSHSRFVRGLFGKIIFV